MSKLHEIIQELRESGKFTMKEIAEAFDEAAKNPMLLSMLNLAENDKIGQILQEIGMNTLPPYWKDAIAMYRESGERMKIGKIYEEIGTKYSYASVTIRDSMHRSLKKAIENCSPEAGERIFGKMEWAVMRKYPPTNKQFLEKIVSFL